MYMVCSRMYPSLLVEDVAPSQWLNRSDEKIDRLCPDRRQQVPQSTTTLRTVKEAQGMTILLHPRKLQDRIPIYTGYSAV